MRCEKIGSAQWKVPSPTTVMRQRALVTCDLAPSPWCNGWSLKIMALYPTYCWFTFPTPRSIVVRGIVLFLWCFACKYKSVYILYV
jgi:hypothetical protein